MKKIIALVLSLILIFSIAGCNEKEVNTNTENKNQSSSVDTTSKQDNTIKEETNTKTEEITKDTASEKEDTPDNTVPVNETPVETTNTELSTETEITELEDDSLNINPLGLGTEWYGNDGKDLVLNLVENPTTGYIWSYHIADSSIVSLTEDKFEAAKSADGTVGAGGIHTMKFTATSEGDTLLSLKLSRATVADDIIQVVMLNLHVQGNGMIYAISALDETEMHLALQPTDCDEYGYCSFIAPATGVYQFILNIMDDTGYGSSSDEAGDWKVYVLDERFDDAERFINQAYTPVVSRYGSATVKAGQIIYIYCPANEWAGNAGEYYGGYFEVYANFTKSGAVLSTEPELTE